MDTYAKPAEPEEYEVHKFFLDSGIRTAPIVSYDGTTLVTEFIPGKTLLELTGEWLTNTNFFRIALNLITAVEQIHNLGYLHGDLNPSNIIVYKDKVYLIDFEFSSPISSNPLTLEEEMMELVNLLVLLLCRSGHLTTIYDLMNLCEKPESIRISLQLKRGVDYDTIRDTILPPQSSSESKSSEETASSSTESD